MSSSSERILLTGISGFLGAQIAHQLLQDGYRVRGVVRSAKLETVKGWYKDYGNKVDIVVLDDLVHGSFKESLEGVNGVIHAATPLPGRSASNEDALEASIEGSVNILRQTEAAGIKNFVLISSIVAVTDFSKTDTVNDRDWVPVTREQALSKDSSPRIVYTAQKAISEREVWNFAEQHPHLEVASINPVYVIGPFAPEFTIPDGRLFGLSTNSMVYDLLRPDGPDSFNSRWVDPRDVAIAAVRSLRAPPTSEVGRKRFILSADEWVSPKEVVEYIAEVRPELKDRLSKAALEAPPATKNFLDASRTKEVLHLEPTPWKVAFLDAVDSILAIEQDWQNKRLTPY